MPPFYVTQDHIVGMASQECETSLHMGHRTDDINSGGFEQPHSVVCVHKKNTFSFVIIWLMALLFFNVISLNTHVEDQK